MRMWNYGAVSTLAPAFANEVKCMRMEFYLICHGFSILHLIRTTMNEIQVTPINFISLYFFRFQFDSNNATHFIHVQMRKSSVHGRFLCCDDLSRCQSFLFRLHKMMTEAGEHMSDAILDIKNSCRLLDTSFT